MIRKDPQSIRKANPAFANISDEQIMAYADQLEQVFSWIFNIRIYEYMQKCEICIYLYIYIYVICVYEHYKCT
jgi:hypothetical protein